MNYTLNERQQSFLLQLARDVIGLASHDNHCPELKTMFQQFSMGDKLIFRQNEIQQNAASFVTLKHIDSQGKFALRGCIGSLEANRKLADDVAQHAYAAAFHDPRFQPVKQGEIQDLHISISVLSSPSKLEFADEQALLELLQPGIDGLILEYRDHRATFLPSVWEQLGEKKQFLNQLKKKAGLPPDFWSNEIVAKRYQATHFSEPEASTQPSVRLHR